MAPNSGLPFEVNPEDPQRLYEGIEYKEFWRGTQRHALDELEHWVVRQMLPSRGRRIVDIGCGYGRLADCYLDRFEQVVMVDGSMSLLRQAYTRTGGRATYIACDVLHMPFRTASFDVALMIRVFHHISDSSASLSEMQRILCGNGRIIFSYMNKQNLKRIILWIAGRNKEYPFSNHPGNIGTTLISHHPRTISELLQTCYFSPRQTLGVGVFDKLAGKTTYTLPLLAAGKRLAPFLAKSKIAPWMFCQAVSLAQTTIVDASDIHHLLHCPLCEGAISGDEFGFLCLSCSREYPFVDGILDMRV